MVIGSITSLRWKLGIREAARSGIRAPRQWNWSLAARATTPGSRSRMCMWSQRLFGYFYKLEVPLKGVIGFLQKGFGVDLMQVWS